MSLNLIRRSHGPSTSEAVRPREVSVRVRGGYQPDTIRAEAGVPLRLVFRREESSPCSEQVVFPALGKSAMLPQGERVAVELLVDDPGEYEFTCAMGMLHGTLVVGPRGGLTS
jgi:plastocyanin domain-containing protein